MGRFARMGHSTNFPFYRAAGLALTIDGLAAEGREDHGDHNALLPPEGLRARTCADAANQQPSALPGPGARLKVEPPSAVAARQEALREA